MLSRKSVELDQMGRIPSVLAVATVAALTLAAPAAKAAIFLGLQQDAGAIVPVVPISSGPGFAINLSAFGQFESVAISGFGQPLLGPPNLLIDTATLVNIAGSENAGTLRVYVTSTGNTAVTG